jgi:FixJ family two-component response regulator
LEPQNAETRTVVVVDDDDGVARSLARVLGLGGFTPVTYSSAEQLLSGAMPASVACVVLDVQLPGMSGYALYDRLMAAGNPPPVIFITASEPPDEPTQSPLPGSVLLYKPFPAPMLLEALDKVMRR